MFENKINRELLPHTVLERISLLKRRIFFAAFLETFFSTSLWFIFLAGGLVVAVRSAFPILAPYVSWAWISLPLSVITALILSLRNQQSTRSLLTLCDILGKGGGLLLAVNEIEDSFWAQRLPSSLTNFTLPGLKLAKGSFPVIAAFLFLVASFLIPQKEAEAGTSHFLAQEITSSLEKQLSSVETAGITQKEKTELKKAIKLLREETEKKVDSASLESADQLSKRLAENILNKEDEIDKTLNKLNSISEKLKPSKKANSHSKNRAKNSSESTRDIMQQLAMTAQSLSDQGIPLKLTTEAEDFLKKLKKQGSDQKLSEQQCRDLAKQLSKACRNMKSSLSVSKGSLCRLCKASSEFGYGDKAFKLLKECKPGKASGSCFKPGAGKGGKPGAGKPGSGGPGANGISRGPGDAPMIWGKESQGNIFRKELAPPNFIFPTDKDISFETFSNPETNPAASRPGVILKNIKATGSSYDPPRIPPSRLKAVKKYFSQGAAR